ncbi:hypothetical protein [Microbacterium sp. SD291]|uniref:hypothetical protein n=1 Tax=Microbacterium sp. SD291 TaxID=2782007 RepID=UPI001A9620FA|nr:hypothetical protein [Microbacterium sp. SD291]MBO0979162.1 hypothetical protein [Microbacterium sp. SD291]
MTPPLIILLSLLGALAVFQVALACGAPWGRLAWGGTHRVLPRHLRIGSLVSVILYGGFAALLLSRAGALPGGDTHVIVVLTWILFGYFMLGIALNAVSRSRPERWTMTPVCAIMAVMTLLVALT